MKRILVLLSVACMSLCLAQPVWAQTCSPTAVFTYTDKDGEMVVEENAESYSGSAPLQAVFTANPSDVDDYDARYEWVIYEQGKKDSPLIHRFDERLEYTFTSSGAFVVELTATFVLGTDTISYPDEGEEPTRFSISIAESILEMPNAFSPGNDESPNNIYKAKDGHQSIVEFKATIFNRWGKRLYSWNDVNGGWDGRVNGRIVKDGVYFVNVVAKGADGHVYHIRKDVNVLTHYNESSGTGGGGDN